ncbi:MAG: hypothetical protein CL760_01180 [Chloroflexi bacterium]|nr:hypothetical protein [Chloroflexota bacterium]|tara:strand:+ start:13740 stop:14258 length:519 start_codon:yes stop_codon:yes gene_type:complete
MIIKLSYDKLKEILNNERVDLYLKEDRCKLYEIFKFKNLFCKKGAVSDRKYSKVKFAPESKNTDNDWRVLKDPQKKSDSPYNSFFKNGRVLNIDSIYFFERNKSKLAVLKDYDLTEFGIECDIDYLEEIKKNETDFKRFDEYFKKYIGDIKELDLEEEIKNAIELKELDEGI